MERGEIVAGPLVRAACLRHLRDLETAEKRGWRWDPERAHYAIRFFEQVLRLNGGEFEGKLFILQPWQAFIVGSLFGWLDIKTGFRRFTSAYLEVGKGNGKSPLAAGIGHFMLIPDEESRAEVYAAASKKDQAMVLFRDAVAMVNQSPLLNSVLVKSGGEQHTYNLAFPRRASFFRAISSDDSQSGPRPHCALVDELHEHPDDNVVEMMRAGFKFRRQPLLFMITNSGVDRQSICWIQHEYAEKVVKRELDDDRYFSFICGLDDGDDPFKDEACWLKANPNLGVSITHDYLRGQVHEARGMPSKKSKVMRLNFCKWTDASNPWIEREVFEAVLVDFDPEKELKGCRALGGLDLSGTRDLTALAFYFPKEQMAFVEFWTPIETLEQRMERDKLPFLKDWVEKGFLRTTPGRAVDYRYVVARIAELQLIFEIPAIAFDPYRIKYMEAAMAEDNVEVKLIPHPQGFYRSTEAGLWMPRSVELTEKKIADKSLRIKLNPVLSWNSASAVMHTDPKDNSIFDKRKSKGRIDGLTALAQAIGLSEVKIPSEPSYNVHFI